MKVSLADFLWAFEDVNILLKNGPEKSHTWEQKDLWVNPENNQKEAQTVGKHYKLWWIVVFRIRFRNQASIVALADSTFI